MINKRLLIKNLLAHNDESSFYDKKLKINISSKEGKAKFLKTSDNQIIYGSSETANGTLMKLNTSNQTVEPMLGTNLGTQGMNPTKMIKASTDIIYGICGDNSYGDRLFSYNTSTDEYSVLVNVVEANYGVRPVDIIETTNWLIYFHVESNGILSNQNGKLIEYDPNNDTHQLVHFFETNSALTQVFDKLKLHESNNIIYGTKGTGGSTNLNNGVIFSYNTNTHAYSILYESSDLFAENRTYLSTENKLYGITLTGGVNDLGILYVYDISTNQFTLLQDLTAKNIIVGSFETVTTERDASFVETDDAIYGVFLQSHGVNDGGSIFKIEKSTNSFSIEYQFDNATNNTGALPLSIYLENSKFYGNTRNSGSGTGNNRFYVLDNGVLTNVSGFSGRTVKELDKMNNQKFIAVTDSEVIEYDTTSNTFETLYTFNSDFKSTYSGINLGDAQLSTNQYEIKNVRVFPIQQQIMYIYNQNRKLTL